MDEYDDLLARVRSGSAVPAAPALPAAPSGAPKMDEYDSLLKQVRTPDLVPAQTANYNGSFSNPAQAAERINLARDIKKMLGEDISPSIVDPVEDRRRIRQAEMDHGINQSASFRKWIEDDPGNAGLLGQKDVSNLLTVDGALHAGRRVFGSAAAGLTADPAAAFYTTLAMPFKLGEQAVGMVLPDWLAQSEMGKALLWAARESKKTGDVAAGARGDEGNIEAGIYSGFRSLGGNLGTMATGGALGLGAKGTTAMMSAIAGGGSALKAFDQGKSASSAALFGTADAAAEYATELPGMKALLATPGLKQGMMEFAKKVANFGVKEMLGEQVATIWQDFNEWALLNPEKTLDDFIAARPDAAIQTAVATMVGGGGQIAIQQAMVRGRQAETRALFDALHAGAENSELLKAVPEKYREFVKKATAEGGVDTVFIPAEQFTTYFQGRDMDPALVASELGASNYVEAMAVGSDVMIPMDAFATLIAGTDHYAGLADDLRLSQGDLTARELSLAEANKDASLEKMQADIERIAAENDTSLNAQIKQITDDVALQLGARYDKQTSETMSQVMRGIAVLTARDVQGKAEAEGLTASEAEIQQAISAQLAKYDIRINANPLLPEILTKRQNFKAEIDPMLDMIRAGQGPSEQDIFGTSLVDFIRERGGLAPVGELADVEKVKTPAFKAKLIQDLGKRLDEMAMAAVEAGYFPGVENGQLTETQLVEAILNELGGAQKTFSGFDEQKLNMRETLEGLSKALDQYGLDPKTMDNEAIKAALFAEPTYQQDGENRAQIRIGADRKINIDLLKDANFSSFLHEAGHFYLEFLGALAENGSQQTKDDYAAILKWFGIASRDQITTEHHEMFARANERYLMEGKAPSKELRATFARFKAWLTSIYRSLVNLKVPLTNEVREVFDRIYATDAEIAAARAENDFIDTFVTAEQMGVSQAEFEAYKKQAAGEIQEGTDELQSKIMRVQRLKREAWWRDELDRTRKEVGAELDAMQIYQTFDALSEKDAELKLDRKELIERYGAPILKRLPRGYGEGKGAIYTAADERGTSVETAAQLMGYSSADALIEDMANLRPRRKLIAAEADARMNERYGDILNSIELADEAQESLHNEERGKKLAMEVRALNKAIGRALIDPESMMREAARRVMAAKLIRDVRPNDYLIAERKANREAFKAMAENNRIEAFEAKQRELLNFAMYREATRVKDEMKKLHDFVARFEKGPMREKLGKAGEQYAEAAQAILEDVELTNRSLKAIDRTKLRQWLQMQENQDLYVTEDMVSGTFAKNWKDLSVEEMRAISDALRNIDHVAGRQLKIMVGQKAIDLAEWAAMASESIRANGGKPKDLTMEDGGRFAKFFASFNAQNRKLSSLARQMDGDTEAGPMFDGLIRGMNERGAWEADENAKATKALIELYRPVLAMKGGMKDVRYIPELKTSLSRGARLSMLLNWGNEGNRQRLQSSDYGNGILTQDQISAVLKTITRQEAEFVNATWKFIDSYWPQIAAKEKRVYGVAPEKVEALPFSMTLADGTNIQMTGGYYPIKYDATKDDKAAAHDQSQLADEVMRGAFTAQTTRKGHTEARAEAVKRPVRLSLDVITEHVAQVTHDLAWHEWLIDATKILRNKAVSSAIRDHFGDPVLKTMRDALTGIAVGDLANQTATDTALLYLRANVQRSTMGLSLTTAFMQPFGLTQSMARIGVKPVLSGIAHWAGDAAHFENTLTKIREKSVFMQGRGETFNRELHEIRGRVTGNQSKARQIYDASLFMMMQKMQMIADVPTWLGAYNKALAENPDEGLAVALADRAVIESQGGGQTKDLTEFQRKHPMLNVFFSYFSVTYNLMAESTAKTQFTKPAAVAGWLADMMLLAVIPALGPAILLALLRGEGDDDEEEWMKKLVKWQAAYLLGTVPLLREGGGTVEGYGYAGPPAARIVTDLQKFGAQVKRAWQNEGDVDEAGILSAVRLMGTVLGVPITQAVRSYKGWKAWEEGSAPATAVLVGPPRND